MMLNSSGSAKHAATPLRQPRPDERIHDERILIRAGRCAVIEDAR